MIWIMQQSNTVRAAGVAAGIAFMGTGCFAPPENQEPAPRTAYFVGIDVSGSFRAGGRYDDAIAFAAHYIHAHLNGFGELEIPRALFVGAIGGESADETQGFHPIHDFENKSVDEIEADLREWFPPEHDFTDFNAFFQRVATLAKRYNLVLSPIDIVVLTDGIPDPGTTGIGTAASPEELYAQIDLDPLEYLSRNVTVRMLYPDPDVAVRWERDVPHSRVRMWTVDRVVMDGWRDQLRTTIVPADRAGDPAAAAAEVATGDARADSTASGDSGTGLAYSAEPGGDSAATATGDAAPAEEVVIEWDQPDLWRWMRDNVDYRVRRGVL